MYIVNLLLRKYRRLYVSNILELDFRPNKKIQIILGTNGGGKSSLLKELIPNTDDLKNDYGEDGFKHLLIKHNNKKYEIGYIRETNKHSFKVDGKELNQAGLLKTQNILIFEHFGINKDIHGLLLSTTNFTSMSVSERKKWFTNILTTVDYSHALDTYNKVKIRVRDITSYIKLTQSKLLKDEEVLKEYTDDKVKLIRKDIEMFQEMLENVIAQKTDNPIRTQVNKEHINKLVSFLSKINITNNKSDINNNIYRLNTRIKYYEDEVDKIMKEVSEISIDTTDTDLDKNKLTDEFNRLKENIGELIIKYKVDKYSDLKYKVMNFRSRYMDLIDLAEEIKLTFYTIEHLYEKRRSDIEYLSNLLDKKINLENRINNLNKKVKDLDSKIKLQEEYSKAEDVICPVCKTKFKPNHDENLLEHLINEYDKNNKLLIDLEKTYNLVNDEYEKYITLNKYLNDLKNILKQIDFKYVDEYLKNETNDYEELSNIVNIITNLNMSLPNEELNELEDKYTETKNKLEILNKMDGKGYIDLAMRKTKLLEDRIKLIDKIDKLKNELEEYKKQKQIIDKAEKAYNMLFDINKDVMSYKKSLLEKHKNEFLNKVIYEIKKVITDLETKVIEYERIKKHKNELETDLKRFEEELMLNKKIEEYLSPTKGIIGEYIVNTINKILERMNEIINEIWTYEINILPCDIEDSDLTFRFPVKIANIKDIPDVSKGSRSIRDVIDLAFKITAMEFLDMMDYPLILDEFGAAMDEKHRILAYDFIEDIAKENFSQIYIVNHFESMYSRFRNTDVTIINTENLSYKGEYQTACKITHVQNLKELT